MTLLDEYVFTIGSKDHEALLVLSSGALKYHMLCSEFVIFSFLTPSNNADLLEHGWRVVNDKIEIVWDDADMTEKVTGNKGCGCKGAKCDGSWL